MKFHVVTYPSVGATTIKLQHIMFDNIIVTSNATIHLNKSENNTASYLTQILFKNFLVEGIWLQTSPVADTRTVRRIQSFYHFCTHAHTSIILTSKCSLVQAMNFKGCASYRVRGMMSHDSGRSTLWS